MKPKLRTVQVTPVLPEPLKPLKALAYNLYWDWTPEIASLFARVDPELWERSGQNPIVVLGQVDQHRLEALSSDIGFLSHLGRAKEMLARYQVEPRWFQTEHVSHADIKVAYFSAEFGLTGCVPIYSGGLGLLAGDHLKSASDLGVPLVGVGLLYQEGYFRQYLNSDGWQMETYPPNDFYNMPMVLERTAEGEPVSVSVEFPGRNVHAQVWRIDVGRVPLFLLDTNVPANSSQDRQITRALYSGGTELRIQQLMMLGIGGFRALVAMGREPTVCHMNEGHAGFLAVERVRFLIEERGMSYEVARDTVDDGNLFTTHTPVPAGFDVFDKDLVKRHMSAYVEKLGISLENFMGLGRGDPNDESEPLNMAKLAIRHAVQRNGVSRLHGKVSRKLVQSGGAWVDWPVDEVPIDSVTNGIHTHTWVAPEMAKLFDRYLSPSWRDRVSLDQTWAGIEQIPDGELWRAHMDLRQQLVSYVRDRLHFQLTRRGAPDREIQNIREVLNPDALTIGFARRFATYKRATLLFHDAERLARIVTSVDRPVQFIFSGKAHPADIPAKEFIKLIASKLKDERFAGSIIFLEDYEIPVAKYLIRGVDVWLNNPQRPKEASGTSGMKVLPNGGLNCSILDGWWAEGYEPGLGWAIGNGEDWEEGRDAVEANAMYDQLESQIIPLFYERDTRGVPHRWVQMMKASMQTLTARFSTDRMVAEYVERFYVPTAIRVRDRLSGDVAVAEALVGWKRKVQDSWGEVQILDIHAESQEAQIGKPLLISSRLRLGALSPSDVEVQLYHGTLDARDEIHEPFMQSMEHVDMAEGVHSYSCRVPFRKSGRYGYTVRIVPKHQDVLIPNELEVICWADSQQS